MLRNKSILLLVSFLVLSLVFGCASQRHSDEDVQKSNILGDAAGEVSLRSDRSDLAQARAEIPEEIKKQNDEIALVMSFVVRESEEDPQRLRDRFSQALRKKREAVDKKVRQARDGFSKKERDDREAFLKKSKTERDQFLSSRKRSGDERQKFFADQDDRRKSFFADQQEKRKDFEMKVQDERKASDDFIREKQNAFNQEWRGYQQRFTERKNKLELKKRMESKSRDLERAGKVVQPVTPLTSPATSFDEGAAEAAPTTRRPSDPLAEFDQIPAGPATPLVPGKSGP